MRRIRKRSLRMPAASRLLYYLVVFSFPAVAAVAAATIGRRLPGPHEEEDEEEEVDHSSLSDIFLCMGIAFGWAIFIVRSFSKSSMIRYATQGIHVNGHVLESSVDVEGGRITGIPSYRALVDYVYEFQGNTFQVRKAFETDKLLENGFSNVELLVLPEEPTSGILVKRWETEYQLEQQEEVSRRQMMYVALALGAVFVVLSIGGAVLAVLRLAEEDQTTGWICLGTAIVLLGPLAFLLYRYAKRCLIATRQSVEDGMILSGNVASLTPNLKSGVGKCLAIDPCDALDGLETTTTCGHPTVLTKNFTKPRKRLDDESLVEPQFYFVCMPSRVDSMSASTMSSLSVKDSEERLRSGFFG